jgi:hypothetical protein
MDMLGYRYSALIQQLPGLQSSPSSASMPLSVRSRHVPSRFTKNQADLADLNQDGVIDVFDLALLKRTLLNAV